MQGMEMVTNKVLNHIWIIILHKYFDQIKRIKIKIPNICNEDNWYLFLINTHKQNYLYILTMSSAALNAL